MISKEKRAEPLTWFGLFILVLLAFQVLSGESFHIDGNIVVDSTFIVALIDLTIIGYGLATYSKKMTKDVGKHRKMEVPFAELAGIVAAFLFSTLFLLLALRAIPWHTVVWFDPPLNFQLIREHGKSNLFISLLLILVLTMILAHSRVEPKSKSNEKKIIKRTANASEGLSNTR